MGRRWLTRKGNYILKSNLLIDVQNMTLKSTVNYCYQLMDSIRHKDEASKRQRNSVLSTLVNLFGFDDVGLTKFASPGDHDAFT